jgi:hypothetical protein
MTHPINSSSKGYIPEDDEKEESQWITPQEQLERLALPYATDHVNAVIERLATEAFKQPLKSSFKSLAETTELLKDVVDKVIDQSIAELLNIEGHKNQVPSLFDLVIKRLVPPSPLLAHLTNAIRALALLGMLPERIPALPDNIIEILNSRCSVFNDGRTVAETHTLMLIPGGLTLDEFEAKVRAYGAANYRGDNPLQFRYFWDQARQEHGKVSLGEAHWVLITKDVIPGSRNRSYADQSDMVAHLGNGYEVPKLGEAIAALFLHKIATRESLYTEGNEQNGDVYTDTRVKETTQNYHLVVGGSAPSGVDVSDIDGFAHGSIGVAALRKF